VIDASVRQYSEAVRANFAQATDFDTKKQFLLDHVDKVVYAITSAPIFRPSGNSCSRKGKKFI
jgi:hypothetical protein